MKVRIKKCDRHHMWYYDKTGMEFEVLAETLSWYGVHGGKKIYKSDCEVVREWYDGLTYNQIDIMKENLIPLSYIDSVWQPWMSRAFREMPAEDRVFLKTDGEWVSDAGLETCDGVIYRLHEDWTRLQKSELFEKLRCWENTLQSNDCPLGLMQKEKLKLLMQQALEAGLCEKYCEGRWRKTYPHSIGDYAVRLAPDWRERLAEKGGAV